jgi:hypothetical protein
MSLPLLLTARDQAERSEPSVRAARMSVAQLLAETIIPVNVELPEAFFQ